jgi:hypothetical protein
VKQRSDDLDTKQVCTTNLRSPPDGRVDERFATNAIAGAALLRMIRQRMLKNIHSPRIALTATIAALCLALAPVALGAKGGGAAKGGGSGKGGSGGTSGGSISLVVLNSTDGLAHWNGEVTFNVSTTATSEPWVELVCYQSGTSVYRAWDGYFERSLTTRDFWLSSSGWTGGAADCTAWLETPKGAQLASTSFHVYP